jgi:transposase, IS5 family
LKRRKGGEAMARKAGKKIKTIAGRLVRDLERKLTPSDLQKWGVELSLYKQVLQQKKNDSNKIYRKPFKNIIASHIVKTKSSYLGLFDQ